MYDGGRVFFSFFLICFSLTLHAIPEREFTLVERASSSDAETRMYSFCEGGEERGTEDVILRE